MSENLYCKYLIFRGKGQGLVEYAIMVAVVIAAVILIMGIFGNAIQDLYQKLVDKIIAIVS